MAKSAAQKKSKETVAEQQETLAPEATAAETASPEPVQLTILDLQQLSRIVDLSSRRGAFQANELSQVGAVYNKLTGFLAYVQAVQEKEESEKENQKEEA